MEGQPQNIFSHIHTLDELKQTKQQLKERRIALFREKRKRQVERMIALGTKWNTVLESNSLNEVTTDDDCGFFTMGDYRVELCEQEEDGYVFVDIIFPSKILFQGRVYEDGRANIRNNDKAFQYWAQIAPVLEFVLFFLKNLMAQRIANDDEEKGPEKKKAKN